MVSKKILNVSNSLWELRAGRPEAEALSLVQHAQDHLAGGAVAQVECRGAFPASDGRWQRLSRGLLFRCGFGSLECFFRGGRLLPLHSFSFC